MRATGAWSNSHGPAVLALCQLDGILRLFQRSATTQSPTPSNLAIVEPLLDPRNSTNEANYVPWLCLEKRNKFDARWNLRKESQTILEITGQF